MKFITTLLITLNTVIGYSQVNSARKLLLTGQGERSINLTPFAYKTVTPTDQTLYEVEAYDNPAYLSLGYKWYYTIPASKVIKPDVITSNDSLKGFQIINGQYEELYRFMRNAPYRSVRSSTTDTLTYSFNINEEYISNVVNGKKRVYMGIIADNEFDLYQNGQLLVKSGYGSVTYADRMFRYLNIIPVDLMEDINLFTMFQRNDGGPYVSGVIVWDNAPQDLFFTGNNVVDLSSLNVVWSTEYLIGEYIYNCPPGYSTNEESGLCVKIEPYSEYDVLNDLIYIQAELVGINPADIEYWEISFGDRIGVNYSGNSYKPYITHKYSHGGNYTIQYNVTLTDGSIVTTEIQITT